MLIISFDAVGDSEFDIMAKRPAFSAFIKESATHRDVSTIFLSNTYPIHASVVTGVKPDVHGVISNTEPFPSPNPVWITREDAIKAKTLWQIAAEKGMKTAAVLWPVTAYSKSIRYNIPEVLARAGKSQIITNLKAGSKALQLKMIWRHYKLVSGTNQPNLDYFSTACMVDILRKHNPDLALIHLTAFDALCHIHGKDSEKLELAYEALDENLSKLLAAAGEDRDIILFSDHSQKNVHTTYDPNTMLEKQGFSESHPSLKKRNNNESSRMKKVGSSQAHHGSFNAKSGSSCFFECCGGSAFFHAGTLLPERIGEVRRVIENGETFRRFLSQDEMHESGHSSAAFGFCAKDGYCYSSSGKDEKANHGYPLDTPDYKVFYVIREAGNRNGSVSFGGSILDIAPLAAQRLGGILPQKKQT